MAKKQDPDAIWREFETKTQDWSAWLVLRNGDPVAKIVTHYGGRRSPSGLTVRAFVHVLGLPMVRGTARGGGYDMRTAAIGQAVRHLPKEWPTDKQWDTGTEEFSMKDTLASFLKLVDQGYDIPHQLRAMGFQVEAVM